jgi:formylglycine-generating enzyme required for sulfatase activity
MTKGSSVSDKFLEKGEEAIGNWITIQILETDKKELSYVVDSPQGKDYLLKLAIPEEQASYASSLYAIINMGGPSYPVFGHVEDNQLHIRLVGLVNGLNISLVKSNLYKLPNQKTQELNGLGTKAQSLTWGNKGWHVVPFSNIPVDSVSSVEALLKNASTKLAKLGLPQPRVVQDNKGNFMAILKKFEGSYSSAYGYFELPNLDNGKTHPTIITGNIYINASYIKEKIFDAILFHELYHSCTCYFRYCDVGGSFCSNEKGEFLKKYPHKKWRGADIGFEEGMALFLGYYFSSFYDYEYPLKDNSGHLHLLSEGIEKGNTTCTQNSDSREIYTAGEFFAYVARRYNDNNISFYIPMLEEFKRTSFSTESMNKVLKNLKNPVSIVDAYYEFARHRAYERGDTVKLSSGKSIVASSLRGDGPNVLPETIRDKIKDKLLEVLFEYKAIHRVNSSGDKVLTFAPFSTQVILLERKFFSSKDVSVEFKGSKIEHLSNNSPEVGKGIFRVRVFFRDKAGKTINRFDLFQNQLTIPFSENGVEEAILLVIFSKVTTETKDNDTNSLTVTYDSVDSCKDRCSLNDKPRCRPNSSSVIEHCKEERGCNVWIEKELCHAEKPCKNGACVCETSCQIGETLCENEKIKTCKQDSSIGCPKWSTPESCPANQSCVNQHCVSKEDPCVQTCKGYCGNYQGCKCSDCPSDKICDKSNQCVPKPESKVNSVTPLTANGHQLTTFTVLGSNLPTTLAAFITDCSGLTYDSRTSTKAVFSCTPQSIGVKLGVIKDKSEGTELFSFKVTVSSLPQVTSVSPTSADLNQSTIFTITGSNLPATIAAFIDGCANVVMGFENSTKATFVCTPSVPGNKDGVIKDMPGGLVLFNFVVRVATKAELMYEPTPKEPYFELIVDTYDAGEPSIEHPPQELEVPEGWRPLEYIVDELRIEHPPQEPIPDRTPELTPEIAPHESVSQCPASCTSNADCVACPAGQRSCVSGKCASPSIFPSEVIISAGSFTMGSPSSELGRYSHEGPQRTVTLTRSFAMWKYEVTQGEFQALMGYNPSYFNNCGANCPVEDVNWYEAAAFCNVMSKSKGLAECFDCTGSGTSVSCTVKSQYSGQNYYNCKGYRLPTEAEWEYAYRAGTSTAFYNGDITKTDCGLDPNLDKIGWYCGNASKTQPVGGKQANAWGLHDMAGNVYEWVYDWYQDSYSGLSGKDPVGPSTSSVRVRRGGGYDYYAQHCRAADRYGVSPGDRHRYLGFRFLRSL